MEEQFLRWWHWKSHLHQFGEVVTSCEVVAGRDIVLKRLNDHLGICHVWDKVMVGLCVDLHHALGLPVFEPSCNNFPISIDCAETFTRFHELFDFWQVTQELLDCSKDLLVVLGDDVGVNIAHVGLELWCILEAFLHVCLVVMSCESMLEASNHVCNCGCGQLESFGAWQLISYHFRSLNWEENLHNGRYVQGSGIPIT